MSHALATAKGDLIPPRLVAPTGSGMPHNQQRSSTAIRVLSFSLLLLCVALVSGCGEKGQVPLIPVTGIVKAGGAPMPMGTVEYHPDSGKGNTFTGTPKGMIKSDGTYTLVTDGRDGAPVGWYKVTISGQGMPDPSKMTEPGKVPAAPTVNPKYTKADTSGFNFEVKEGATPGAYDLSLIK